MDLIELARALGRALQQDERFTALQVARQNSDEDPELQRLIGEFNLKRMAIQNEGAKQDRSEEKLQQYNAELRHCYAEIMKNPNMTAYNAAKEEMDALLQRIQAILTLSAQGEDPNTADYTPSCGGDCSGCAGCS